jgi:hypothetical protein
MARVKSTVTIARPVEEVFRFLLDLDRNAPFVSRAYFTPSAERSSPLDAGRFEAQPRFRSQVLEGSNES